MTRFLFAVMAFIFCVSFLTAQQPIRPLPTKLDDYARSKFMETVVTTELIECSSSSNVYTININRNYGVPRFGVITDCSQNVDTVWYMPNNITGSTSGGINTPLVTNADITVWWKEGTFNVKIMDVLTGNVVLDTASIGQQANEFDNKIDSIQLADSTTIAFDNLIPKKTTNPGVTINYSYLPNGLYWVYIIDGNNVIWYMNTIRKGI